ncbi:hypothetical protein PHYSODRAFT_508016 [Phytophthora sojae]|uniref:MULE transposase domain-containing protein n=1 Tax=Phytophthora sojae (strain P6497) TaxID=1094619 RepID=G4ZL61_PHYSP|nr:hypothetical protein PHYSODRAFT_508016 [Phytophthora sojae]EGZ15575.1 hypothetical protein PHYSODRAFT_508016 [Phytophthora sojae]|eukprot:XP_009529324.1 hypothetical protein PHYSODRAFT_508016 [Phytophthora sojae]
MADAADQHLQPGTVIADFEQALIDSVQGQFPDARVVGCLFHWKQALRRRLVGLSMSRVEIGVAMEIGVLDMLTVVPPGQVDPYGIDYAKRTIRQRCERRGLHYSSTRWTRFWVYFRRTWMVRFPPDVWNVQGIDLRVVSRTNDPLERFKRELNTAITTPHPSLPSFVGTINTLLQRYVQLLNYITNRRAVAPVQVSV